MTMKITVTTTMLAAPDGITTRRYLAGETYNMPDELGAVFVREKWGTEVRETGGTIESGEKKKAKGPAENK